MATVAERRQAAVIGTLVADAAVQPLHWIYNEEKLDGLIAGKEEIEFWTPSENPFYRIETGLHSCYGDQAFAVLKSLVEAKGVDGSHLIKTIYDSFGPNSPYEDEVNKQNAGSKENKATSSKMPIDCPWRNGSIKQFLQNVENGSTDPGSETDENSDCLSRMVPVVALYAGQPQMLEQVEKVLRVTQKFKTTVAVGLAAARILEQFILHGKTSDVTDAVIKQLEDPKRSNPQDLDRAVAGFIREVLACVDKPHREVVKGTFKKNCHLPGAFQSALHGMLIGADYVSAIHTTIRAGGENCSRGGFIGACLAAQNGLSSIPKAWTSKTKKYSEILNLSQQLVAMVPTK